jgi:signal transduction histidine kinase
MALAWRNLTKSADLQVRLVRASELNKHLAEMNLAAAGLAHETRNPLNIIRGHAQLLSRHPQASTEVCLKTREITDEVDRVTARLNDFINYSKPREVRPAAVALGATIRDVARALQYDLEDKRVNLETRECEATVEADEGQLRQLLFNLLLNAVQAVEPGGKIEVGTYPTGRGEVVLEVRDNGPGVDPSQREEIFKPYFTTHQKGTGLGLAVVQQIVLAHGWEIRCLDNEPRGAIFEVSRMRLVSVA